MRKSLRLNIFFRPICNKLEPTSSQNTLNKMIKGMKNPILIDIKYTRVDMSPHRAKDPLSPIKIWAGLILNRK